MSVLGAMRPAPAAIGRFEILRTLGKGAQGSVYLARDTHLGREVAIKAVAAGADPEDIALLLQEARVISRFSHPNIVTLYDALEIDGGCHLVLEYVAGETLAALLRRQGKLERQRALRIAIQVAEGLAYAHAKNVVHRDIKPANIMIDAAGTARIMDFGIAAAPSAAPADGVAGTPGYMAPEQMRNDATTAAADVFSLGMVLYEMLAGRPAATGASIFEIMHKTANEPFAPPSRFTPEIEQQLDHLVLRAIGKDVGERFASAAAFKQALEDYLAPAPVAAETPGAAGSALAFLQRRRNQKSGFPALSQTISAINRISASSDESVQSLSAVLLKDFALTNKLLRLVNSSNYRQFGGAVSTISRAVMILGFDAVRDLAITLILFEHLQNKTQAVQLKEEAITAYFTGIMAHRVAAACGLQDREEGFICGIFHHLGRLLAGYYFYEEWCEINRRIEDGEIEDKAARAVLGISFEELGIEIARSWSLPEKLVHSMEHLRGATIGRPQYAGDRLRFTANLAGELCRIASESSPESKTAELDALQHRYAAGLSVSSKQLATVVDNSVKEFVAESGLFVPNSGKSRVVQAIAQWSGDGEPATTLKPGGEAAAAAAPDTVDDFVNRTLAIAVSTAAGETPDPAATLTAGIQDLTNTLVGDYNINDVLRIIIETMYRGMNFSHVLLCTRDARANRLQARFGFGPRTEELLKAFAVPLDRPH